MLTLRILQFNSQMKSKKLEFFISKEKYVDSFFKKSISSNFNNIYSKKKCWNFLALSH